MSDDLVYPVPLYPSRRDPARLEQLKAAAAYRAATEPRRMTQDEVDDKVRAILSAAAPPPPPDPLTGRIPPERTRPEAAT